MKVLDLNAYGVSEMNQQELVEANGGCFVGGFLLGALVASMLGWWLTSSLEVPSEDGSFDMIQDKLLVA